MTVFFLSLKSKSRCFTSFSFKTSFGSFSNSFKKSLLNLIYNQEKVFLLLLT